MASAFARSLAGLLGVFGHARQSEARAVRGRMLGVCWSRREGASRARKRKAARAALRPTLPLVLAEAPATFGPPALMPLFQGLWARERTTKRRFPFYAHACGHVFRCRALRARPRTPMLPGGLQGRLAILPMRSLAPTPPLHKRSLGTSARMGKRARCWALGGEACPCIIRVTGVAHDGLLGCSVHPAGPG